MTALKHMMCDMKARGLLAASDHVRLGVPAFGAALIARIAPRYDDGVQADSGVGVLHGRSLPLQDQVEWMSEKRSFVLGSYSETKDL